MTWVRFPSPAPDTERDQTPVFCDVGGRDMIRGLTPYDFAHIAQSVEHFLGKEEVTGSNPVMGSRVEDV